MIGLYKALVKEAMKDDSINAIHLQTFTTTIDNNKVPLLYSRNEHMFNYILTELEFLIKGIPSKKWFSERGIVKYENLASPYEVESEMFKRIQNETVKGYHELSKQEELDLKKKVIKEIDDLGRVPGLQLRDFYGSYNCISGTKFDEIPLNAKLVHKAPDGSWIAYHFNKGLDQLNSLVNHTTSNQTVVLLNPAEENLTAIMPKVIAINFSISNNKENIPQYLYAMVSVSSVDLIEEFPIIFDMFSVFTWLVASAMGVLAHDVMFTIGKGFVDKMQVNVKPPQLLRQDGHSAQLLKTDNFNILHFEPSMIQFKIS